MPIWCCRTRPISSARLHLAARPADLGCRRRRRFDPPAGRPARPRRAAVPGRADRLGARLGLPGLSRRTAARAIPASMPTTSSITSARPGIGLLAGWRGKEANARRWARPIRTSSTPISRTAASGGPRFRRGALFQACQPAYLDWASRMGFIARPSRCPSALYRNACSASAWPPQAMARCSRRTSIAQRIATYFDPLPFWYPPFEGSADWRPSEFPLHAMTQRPMAMYHSWGSQNAWLRQIHGENRLYMHRATAREAQRHRRRRLGADDQPSRPHQAQVKLMEGVNPDTVWTWNAIGKRVRRLEPGARRAGGDAGLPAEPSDRELLPPKAAAIAMPMPIR
jgi:hypothetical protein